MWTILSVFIEFVTVLLLFSVLVFWPGGMWESQLPDQGSNLQATDLEGEVLTIGPPKKSQPCGCEGVIRKEERRTLVSTSTYLEGGSDQAGARMGQGQCK